VADLHEARGEDVEEEAADELLWGKADGATVFRGEADTRVVGGEEAVVGEPDAVGVAAEVAEDLGGTGERALGVDDPVLAVETVPQAGEGGRVGELGAGAGEIESAGRDLAGEGGKELPAEEPGEDADGEEVAAAGADPAGAVGCEPPARDEAVEMRVELEVTGPGVEDGGQAEASAEAVGVEAEGEERARGRAEESARQRRRLRRTRGRSSAGSVKTTWK
jgi:hypothetical protein